MFDAPFFWPEMSPSDVLHGLAGVRRAKQDPKIIDNLVIILYWKKNFLVTVSLIGIWLLMTCIPVSFRPN